MNALARHIQRFDTDEVAPPVDLMIAPQDNYKAPEPDADKVAEALAEGRRLGQAEAERAFEQRLATERETFAQLVLDERSRWSREESERLAQALATASETLFATVSDATSRVLLPFLTARARERAIADLVVTLESLLADGKHPVVTVAGPRDLVAEIADRLGVRAEGVTFQPSERPDVRVVADSTIIETQLATWLGRLAELKD
jgi:hypothetical protein